MPLPLDLASVAWLAWHHVRDRLADRDLSEHYRTEVRTWQRRTQDQARVIRDQQAHIRNLEAQLRPLLVREVAEVGVQGDLL